MSLSSFLRGNAASSTSSAPSFAPSTPSLRPKTSGLWTYAADVDKEGNAPKNGSGRYVWRCIKCADANKRREYLLDGGNAHFKEHLLKAHGIDLSLAKNTETAAADASQLRIDMAQWSSGMRAGAKRPRTFTTGLTQGVLRAAFLNWIAADNLPFKMAKSPSFRAFLELISPHTNQLLPKSDNTIRNDLARAVRLRRPDIERALASASSGIHLIVDAWTSPNAYALFGVKCRFLDQDL